MPDPGKGYVPPPSIGHEMGVLFGFLGLMAACMLAYWVCWRIAQKRGAQRELERREALRQRGFGEKSRQYEVKPSNFEYGGQVGYSAGVL